MSENNRWYLRFPLIYRIEHWVFALSFITLGLTGLAQKLSALAVSKGFIALLGGIESVRIIHRVAAVVMMLSVVYHIGAVGYRVFVLRVRPTMLPSMADVQNAFRAFGYNLGLTKTRPQQGRYTFEEKVEYWAVVWGTLIMVFTGFMLWNPIATTKVLPGQVIPAAKAAHGGEALLAVLAIIIWHLYHVLVRHFNRSMFTGKVDEHTMEADHPLELADIKAGVDKMPVEPKEVKRRSRVFWPLYGILAVLLLVGIYNFVTIEQTATANVPPAETVEVFAPLTPTPLPTLAPTATPAPVPTGAAPAPSTWEGGIGSIFQQKCAGCHGTSTQLGGLNLSGYASALAGGSSGPGIVPGDPDASIIIKKQSAGGHPGQLTPEELETIRAWIEAGATE